MVLLNAECHCIYQAARNVLCLIFCALSSRFSINNYGESKRHHSTNGSELPGAAEIVVAGGGILGSSVAYHLAKFGKKDVVVLEQGRLVNIPLSDIPRAPRLGAVAQWGLPLPKDWQRLPSYQRRIRGAGMPPNGNVSYSKQQY